MAHDSQYFYGFCSIYMCSKWYFNEVDHKWDLYILQKLEEFLSSTNLNRIFIETFLIV